LEELHRKNRYISQIKGKIESYIVSEKEPLSKLIKYIRTIREKHQITNPELRRILRQIKYEVVIPFLKPSGGVLYQPERLARFEKLCHELGVQLD
jgi:hypothetical protein